MKDKHKVIELLVRAKIKLEDRNTANMAAYYLDEALKLLAVDEPAPARKYVTHASSCMLENDSDYYGPCTCGAERK